MPACGSARLFAACHVFRRRMVPGHPPCALISLIFSSLDPETNCRYFLRMSFHGFHHSTPLLRFATGLLLNLLCAVVKVQFSFRSPMLFPCFHLCFRIGSSLGFRIRVRTLKTIQSFLETLFNSHSVDAVRLVNPPPVYLSGV